MHAHRRDRNAGYLWLIIWGFAGLHTVAAAPPVRVERMTPDGVQVAVDAAALRSPPGGMVRVGGFPLEAGRRVELSLRPLKIVDDRTRFWIANERGRFPLAMDPTRIGLWSGRVTGVPGSFVFLAATDGGLYGTVELGPGVSVAMEAVSHRLYRHGLGFLGEPKACIKTGFGTHVLPAKWTSAHSRSVGPPRPTRTPATEQRRAQRPDATGVDTGSKKILTGPAPRAYADAWRAEGAFRGGAR